MYVDTDFLIISAGRSGIGFALQRRSSTRGPAGKFSGRRITLKEHCGIHTLGLDVMWVNVLDDCKHAGWQPVNRFVAFLLILVRTESQLELQNCTSA